MAKTSRATQSRRLRIIGGQWRGRKLSFAAVDNIRPTPDRVRETLFNWLQPYIVGARCLDLFAGSGALGFEAASRGAAEVYAVDSSREAIATMQEQVHLLQANHLLLKHANVMSFLNNADNICSGAFDIVFLDPPFGQDLLAECCQKLEQNNWLAPTAYIYIESERDLKEITMPGSWEIVRSKIAGQVSYRLVKRTVN